MKNAKLLRELFFSFFRIGGLTFGGGLTMLPMLKYELVEKKNWLEEDELLDCYAVGQCTPGIIAINTATYVGYKKAGVLGGIVATLGMVMPSLVIITLVAACLESMMSNVWLQHALMGVRGVVVALMVNTVINLGKKSLINWQTWVLGILAFVPAQMSWAPTIVIVLTAALIGIAAQVLRERGKKA